MSDGADDDDDVPLETFAQRRERKDDGVPRHRDPTPYPLVGLTSSRSTPTQRNSNPAEYHSVTISDHKSRSNPECAPAPKLPLPDVDYSIALPVNEDASTITWGITDLDLDLDTKPRQCNDNIMLKMVFTSWRQAARLQRCAADPIVNAPTLTHKEMEAAAEAEEEKKHQDRIAFWLTEIGPYAIEDNEKNARGCVDRGYSHTPHDRLYGMTTVKVYMRGEFVSHKDMSTRVLDGMWSAFSYLPGVREKISVATNDTDILVDYVAPEAIRGIQNIKKRRVTSARWINNIYSWGANQDYPTQAALAPRTKWFRDLDQASRKLYTIQHNFDQVRECPIYTELYQAFRNDPKLQKRVVLDAADVMLPSHVAGVKEGFAIHPDMRFWNRRPEIVMNTIMYYSQQKLIDEMGTRLGRTKDEMRSCFRS
jgi:hypothetical protein